MDDDIFEVGLPVSIETNYKYYLTTHLIGWEQDHFLITGVVHSGGKGMPLKVHDLCKMRFLKDGVAYGFETQVTAVMLHPFPMTFLKYPKAIEHFTIRKSNRVKSDFEARLLDENNTCLADATMTNISAGGCGLNIPAGESGGLSETKSCKVAFRILDTDICLRCIIRKFRQVQDTCCLGLEFFDVSEAEKETINLFLEIGTHLLTSRMDLIISKLKMSGETLSGQIGELSLADILQILDHMKKEGILNVATDGRKGSIALSQAHIMDASLEGMHPEDALVEFLSLKKGGFQFYAQAVTSGRMKKPISFVLMDTCRLIDERDALHEYYPGAKDTLVLAKDPAGEDPIIRAMVDVFRDGGSTMSELCAATGLSYIRTGLIAARLIKGGFLMKTS